MSRIVSMEEFVKKRLQSLSFYATLGALLGMVSWAGLLNAQTQGSQQPSTPPSAGSEQQPGQQPEAPAQTSPSQNTAPQAGQQNTQPPAGSAEGSNGSAASQNAGAANANGVQTFTGTVTKQGDKYVLQDTATGKTYDIDHQDEVKKFDGKRVRVHGTLSGNTIHVQ